MASALIQSLRFPAVALRHRDILRAFVARDIKARYEGSMLGRLWPLLHPLLLLGVYSLVFAKVLGVRFSSIGAAPVVADGWVTTFFMLSGILPWVCTVESIARATPVVVENSNLIKKVAFPSELLPTYTTMVSFTQMLIGFALFVPLYAVVILGASEGEAGDRWLRLAPLLSALPVAIALQFLFVTGLSMLLAATNIFVRDVGQVLPLASLIWMFFTPIFYKIDAIEQAGIAWVVTAMKWNPMYHLLAVYRGCFSYEAGRPFPIDSLLIFAAIAAGVFLLGHGCFQRWKGQFADEV